MNGKVNTVHSICSCQNAIQYLILCIDVSEYVDVRVNCEIGHN